MMEQRKTLIMTGLVLLLLIGLMVGVIYFLLGFIRPKPSTTRDLFPKSTASESAVGTPPSTFIYGSSTPAPTVASAAPQAVAPPQGMALYQGTNFQLFYPKNWGLLTCNNSQNFEFDPTNFANQTGFPCDRAVKPITVLVGQYSCSGGTTVNLGGVSVRKIVTENVRTTSGGLGREYHLCTNTTPSLDITHRVGSGPAFSSQDYSTQVEQMISTGHFAAGL